MADSIYILSFQLHRATHICRNLEECLRSREYVAGSHVPSTAAANMSLSDSDIIILYRGPGP